MGLLDKLKGAVNAVTGRAAKVTLDFSPNDVAPGGTIGVVVVAQSTGSEVKSGGVFIDVIAEESVWFRQHSSSGDDDYATAYEKSYEESHQIAPALVLGPGETQQFEGTIRIPEEVQPTFTGKNCKHEWKIRGRIEAYGNDPDSGFTVFRVR